MHLRLLAPDLSFALPLAQFLRTQGMEVQTEVDSAPAMQQSVLHLPLDGPRAEVVALLRHLLPVPLTVAYRVGLDRAQLWLADTGMEALVTGRLATKSVRVCGRDGARARRLVGLLRELGFDAAFKQAPDVREAQVQHGKLIPMQQAMLAWALGTIGTPATVTQTEGMARWLAVVHVPDGGAELGVVPPEQGRLVLSGRLHEGLTAPAVRIHGEDFGALQDCTARLREFGVMDVFSVGHSGDATSRQFALTPALRLDGPHQAAWVEAAETAAWVLHHAGVDPTQMPLVSGFAEEKEVPVDSRRIDVALPVERWAAGQLKPWAGPAPERFQLVIRADAGAVGDEVARKLRIAGFSVEVAELPTVAQRPERSRVSAGELTRYPHLVQAVRDAVLRSTGGALVGLSVRFPVERLATLGERVTLDLLRPEDRPSAAQIALRGLDRHQVTVYGEPTQAVGDACARFHELSGVELARRPMDRHTCEPVIRYGGASRELVQAVADEFGRTTGHTFMLEKAWSDGDRDIWVHVPSATVRRDSGDEIADPFGRTWGRSTPRASGFLHVMPTALHVGNVCLPRRPGPRHPLAPSLEFARRMCLDAQTAELLEHVASAVAAGEPCLLEGPTSATKTSGILMLAALLGQPVMRVNLSGQTDTSELIGHYVPDPDGGFRWQDGAAVKAVTEGLWLVLDELNLGPPQVVERLNALLEHPASLTLTERDHRVIGSEECPIHPDFRIFATMNPAEYAGRAALSPAGKDRWIRQLQVASPDAAATEAMLNHAVWAEQPELGSWGVAWATTGGGESTPSVPIAADRPLLRDFFRKLADLHARVLARTATSPDTALGADRREGYAFTRRGLLALLQRLQSEVAAGVEVHEAMRIGLRQAYVDRVAVADRAVLALLMDAVGLGPNTWLVGQIMQEEVQDEVAATLAGLDLRQLQEAA
ncbi:MAG: AAA family ATPase [Myxococcota bacterium]